MVTDSSAKFTEPCSVEHLIPGDRVYLTESYYVDTTATLLEVPRYGWKIKSQVDGVATIEYQRPNWKLLMSIICETRYLKKEA